MNKLLNSTHFKMLGKLSFSQSTVFIAILMATHFLNLLFNVYLGKSLGIEDFGLVTFITSLLYFTNIIFIALIATISHATAYLSAQSYTKSVHFFSKVKGKASVFAVIFSVLWLIATPYLSSFFQIVTPLPLLFYLPIFSLGIVVASSRGFLQGHLQFIKSGAIIISESVTKLLAAALLISFGFSSWAYIAIPLSITAAFATSIFFIKGVRLSTQNSEKVYPFPKKFFVTASLAGLSTMAFLGLDVVLVKHYLSPTLAGQYALLSLIGKTIYFLGSIFNNFTIPLVGKDLGSGRDPIKKFHIIFALTFIAVLFGLVTFGFFGHITASLIFGDKVKSISDLLLFYAFAISAYTISTSLTTYHLAKKEYIFPITAIGSTFLVAVGLLIYHQTLAQIVAVLFAGSLINLCLISILHIIFTYFNRTQAFFLVNNTYQSIGKPKVILSYMFSKYEK